MYSVKRKILASAMMHFSHQALTAESVYSELSGVISSVAKLIWFRSTLYILKAGFQDSMWLQRSTLSPYVVKGRYQIYQPDQQILFLSVILNFFLFSNRVPDDMENLKSAHLGWFIAISRFECIRSISPAPTKISKTLPWCN